MRGFNLKDYAITYKQVFSPEYCQFLINEANKTNWIEHSYYISVDNQLIPQKNKNEFEMTGEDFPEKDNMMQSVWNVINQYVTQDMKPLHSWFCTWNGFSSPRFNRYLPGTEMRVHCDHIQSLFDGDRKGVPTLTVLGSLNDDYEGGELLMWDEPVDLKGGDIIIFPSNFLYPHSVTPVVSGTRYSFVSWVW